MPENLYPALFR